MPFDPQPSLRGKLVSLRPLTQNDFDLLFEVASDPKIWEQHPNQDRYQRPVFEKFFEEALQSGGALVVIDNVSNKIIGSSRFTRADESKNTISVGYTFLARAYWGKLYNKEMKRLMLDHAFKYFEHVEFYVGANNIRSQRALEKIGAKRLREIHRTLPDGSPNPSFAYGISRDFYFSGEMLTRNPS